MIREDDAPSGGMTLDQFRARLRLLYARERGSRSKTGNPACTEAASKLAKREATSEDHRTLAECRAKTRTARKATLEHEAGHEGKAQHLAHRARSQGPVSAKARAARAKELKDARRPAPPPSAEPSKRIIKLKRNPKTPERQAFDAAFHAMHDANRVLQQTVEAHGPYSDAAKSTAGYYKNKIEAAREAFRAMKRSGRAPAAEPEEPAAAPAAGKQPLTWGEKIGAPFTPFSNNTPRAPIDHDLVGHHEHYNFGTSNEHVAYTMANRNLRQARRKAAAAAEAFGADSPQARKFAAERDAAQARFDEVSAPGYTAPEPEKTADVIARLKGANDDASSGGPAPVPSPPASPPSDRLADLAGKPGPEASAKPKATRPPKPPAAPKPPKAVKPEKVRAKVIEAMKAAGPLPSLADVRARSGLDKPTFDAAVNDLIEDLELNGHRHDYVLGATPEEREAMVPARHAGKDPQRTHFAALSLPGAPRPQVKPPSPTAPTSSAPPPSPAAPGSPTHLLNDYLEKAVRSDQGHLESLLGSHMIYTNALRKQGVTDEHLAQLHRHGFIDPIPAKVYYDEDDFQPGSRNRAHIDGMLRLGGEPIHGVRLTLKGAEHYRRNNPNAPR